MSAKLLVVKNNASKTSIQKLAHFMKLHNGHIVLESSEVYQNYISVLFSSLSKTSGANNTKSCDRCYSLIPRSRKGIKSHPSQTKLVNKVSSVRDLIEWSSKFALSFGEQGKTLIRIPRWNPEECDVNGDHMTLQMLLGPQVEEEEGRLGWANKTIQTEKIVNLNFECENITLDTQNVAKATVFLDSGIRSPPISVQTKVSVAASVGRRQRTYSHSFAKQYKRMIERVTNN